MDELLSASEGSHSASQKVKLLRIGNIVSLLFCFGAIIVGLLVHPNIAEVGEANPSYLTLPNLFVNIFWAILFPLQFGFVLYAQFNALHVVQEAVSRGINWYFIASNLLIPGWILFWCKEEFAISEIFIILNTIAITKIHRNLIIYYPPSTNSHLNSFKLITFIHTPFSMYAALTLLDVLHVGFVAFAGTDREYQILACIAVWALAIVGIGWTTVGLWSDGRRDSVFGISIAWILLGIAVQQRSVLFLSIQAITLAIIQVHTAQDRYLNGGHYYKTIKNDYMMEMKTIEFMSLLQSLGVGSLGSRYSLNR
ncbi:14404_t:CDS:2 [Ambispora leptoticha]|uniref:14404_t:CDS:1 n=1 Tax=Ambispora leptoticha TaxID=144679 RepID=A0A9N8YXZ2_9GLOM|nr:14404_t:CDS:2 [Ambispora leptoticha]